MFHFGAMKQRTDKILDVAVELAEKGGFDNVRQRDVAKQAGVALGTLYKRFRNKESILVAALDRESELLERRMEQVPTKGESPADRVSQFFQIVTKGLVKKPHYARAVLRAMASGVPEIAGTVSAYYGRMTGLIIAAMRGVGRLSYTDATTAPPSKRESTLALYLQQMWFANLVGWAAGMFDANEITAQMKRVAIVLMRGMEAEK